ncbi:MAG: RNA polymerase sigma-70 factor [Pedobacter sp.]|jgi:RNA polymerase sigma-70 factor (ECF subfamily)
MKDFDKFSDEKLSVLLFEGDGDAFEEIFNRYWLKLYGVAIKRVKYRETAEEIIQDLFTQLWTKRESIQIHTSLAGYLFTSVRYLVLNHIQKEIVRENYKDSFQAVNTFSHNSTEETVFLNELIRNIEKEVTYLPPQCRSVFELSRKENKTNREIAEVLGISEKTVEGHLTKAIKHLKVGLSEVSRIVAWFFLLV